MREYRHVSNADPARRPSVHAVQGGTDDPDAMWEPQRAGRRYLCFVCGGDTNGASDEDYAELEVLLPAPRWLAQWGAHVTCLATVVTPPVSVYPRQ